MAHSALVAAAKRTAEKAGFSYCSDDLVGGLLATLAASVSSSGRILELGTGTGVGTAWIVSGLNGRTDVEVVTVEHDQANADLAKGLRWPRYVRFVIGDAVEQLEALGTFDLIFADAQGGKWDRLDLTIAALRPGGVLVVDDMRREDSWTEEQTNKQALVQSTLLNHTSLMSCEMDWATGVILSVRRRP